jgi:hypothetical protein
LPSFSVDLSNMSFPSSPTLFNNSFEGDLSIIPTFDADDGWILSPLPESQSQFSKIASLDRAIPEPCTVVMESEPCRSPAFPRAGRATEYLKRGFVATVNSLSATPDMGRKKECADPTGSIGMECHPGVEGFESGTALRPTDLRS